MLSTDQLSELSYSQILSLKNKADEILASRRSDELGQLVETFIRDLSERGFTVDDAIGCLRPAEPAAKRAGARPPNRYPPVFRDPGNPSLTWSGRGKTPSWFQAALNAGHTKDEMRLKS